MVYNGSYLVAFCNSYYVKNRQEDDFVPFLYCVISYCRITKFGVVKYCNNNYFFPIFLCLVIFVEIVLGL